MTTFRAKRNGVSTLIVLIILMVMMSSASVAYFYTNGFQTIRPSEMSGGSQNQEYSVLNDAINDLQKNGNEIVEVESSPSGSINYVTSYSTFKNLAKKQTVYYFVESYKSILFIEKEDKIYAWAPQKWEKLKILSTDCDLQTPGWLITITIKNMGNYPLAISNIHIAGDEIAGTNFNTENYVPLSASCTIKKNTILDQDESITFEIRVSNYYKYLKVGSICEIKLSTSSGYYIKRMINFESSKKG
ncbi:hypothetical protein FJY84_00280 [Candidatus Bathyarchaeota archaeon]|nr:hypothetical protein [Candidatus Bathyarchaeota archaeon]